ncbi:MAG: DUF6390 family protein [Pseudonocardia sp.]
MTLRSWLGRRGCEFGVVVEVRAAARRFTGAWPYLEVLARLTGISDPLDPRLIESYWLGGGVNATISSRAFGEALLEVITPQAGHYWTHLTNRSGSSAPDTGTAR